MEEKYFLAIINKLEEGMNEGRIPQPYMAQFLLEECYWYTIKALNNKD